MNAISTSTRFNLALLPEDSTVCFHISWRWLMGLTVAYLLAPIFLFLLGWVQPQMAIVATLGLVLVVGSLLYYTPSRDLTISRDQVRRGLFALLALALVLFFTGVTGHWKQHPDFIVRNAMLDELTKNPWPLIDSDSHVLNYYFGGMLPAAFFAKLFHASILAPWFLYLWLLGGLGLVVAHLGRLTGTEGTKGLTLLVGLVFWCGLSEWSFLTIKSLWTYSLFDSTLHIYFQPLHESMRSLPHLIIPLWLIITLLFSPPQTGSFPLRTAWRGLWVFLCVFASPMGAIALAALCLFLILQDYQQIRMGTPLVKATVTAPPEVRHPALLWGMSLSCLFILAAFALLVWVPFFGAGVSSTGGLLLTDSTILAGITPSRQDTMIQFAVHLTFTILPWFVLCYRYNKRHFIFWGIVILGLCLPLAAMDVGPPLAFDLNLKMGAVLHFAMLLIFLHTYRVASPRWRIAQWVYLCVCLLAFAQNVAFIASLGVGVFFYLLMRTPTFSSADGTTSIFIRVNRIAIVALLVLALSCGYIVLSHNSKTAAHLSMQSLRYDPAFKLCQSAAQRESAWWWYALTPTADRLPTYFYHRAGASHHTFFRHLGIPQYAAPIFIINPHHHQ